MRTDASLSRRGLSLWLLVPALPFLIPLLILIAGAGMRFNAAFLPASKMHSLPSIWKHSQTMNNPHSE